VAGEHGIFSSVLRVPFTFPPEKFYGNMLSGLGTPDLRGTQGSFSFYSETRQESTDIWEGMTEILEKTGPGSFQGRLRGPEHPFRKGRHYLSTAFNLQVDSSGRHADFRVGRECVRLELDRISHWIPVEFRVGVIRISGVVQLVLSGVDPVRLYVSPIHIDPAKPSMPVSHPKIFSVYLSRLLGSFATLGMAEDTTAVNEKVLSEDAFLQQVYRTQQEREKAFFDSLSKVRSGMVVQVFESTDRIQHMFWRYLPDADSPAETPGVSDKIVHAIRDSYRAMDDFLGRLRPKLRKSDLLIIVSDHGFGAFNRGFHLNSWLHQEGYLVLKDGKKESGKWFADVDWSRSRAYGQGLNGIFLNLKGREKHGIVTPGPEAEALKRELCEKLGSLTDPQTGSPVVRKAWPSEVIYRGPYLRNAPDVVLGYEKGMRVSWESAVNTIGPELYADNTRWWSGDHAFTRDQVPGIFFSNRPIRESNPALLDIAPTVLSAMGVHPPAFMEGRDLGLTAAESTEKSA
jgi:predicted AlkP superfamily phosphohydrolase/phosphomutase